MANIEGVRVFISPVTAVTPTVVFAGNSSVTILCQRGGVDAAREVSKAQSKVDDVDALA